MVEMTQDEINRTLFDALEETNDRNENLLKRLAVEEECSASLASKVRESESLLTISLVWLKLLHYKLDQEDLPRLKKHMDNLHNFLHPTAE